MTIEVIERRTPPAERVYKVRCTQCQSLLQFQARDAEEVYDRNEVLLKVRCPVCKGLVYVLK